MHFNQAFCLKPRFQKSMLSQLFQACHLLCILHPDMPRAHILPSLSPKVKPARTISLNYTQVRGNSRLRCLRYQRLLTMTDILSSRIIPGLFYRCGQLGFAELLCHVFLTLGPSLPRADVNLTLKIMPA